MRKKSTEVQNLRHICESYGIMRIARDDSEAQLYKYCRISITCIAKP